jgi:hypothetical protein
MNLWNRGTLPKGTTYSEEVEDNGGLSLLIEGNPLSCHFNPRVSLTAKGLTNYLIALQVKQFGCHIDLPYPVLVRNMKLLLKKHDALLVARAIKYASQVSDHTYSTKFVGEMIEQVTEKMK